MHPLKRMASNGLRGAKAGRVFDGPTLDTNNAGDGTLLAKDGESKEEERKTGGAGVLSTKDWLLKLHSKGDRAIA